MTAEVLSDRALNRATLERQLLLRRSDLSVLDAVEHLVARRFPQHTAAALAFACRNRLALVQVPPRGVWGQTLQVTTTTAESWLGRPLVANPAIDDVVLRYFAAFGPASVADVTTWCRLTGMREVVELLRPALRTLRDERGRELFDLPDAPRPDPGIPAPPRFLPEYDNVLLSHADRTRFFAADDQLSHLFGTGRGAVLSDGVVSGSWRLDGETLAVTHLERLTKRAVGALAAEARRLVRFLGAERLEVGHA